MPGARFVPPAQKKEFRATAGPHHHPAMRTTRSRSRPQANANPEQLARRIRGFGAFTPAHALAADILQLLHANPAASEGIIEAFEPGTYSPGPEDDDDDCPEDAKIRFDVLPWLASDHADLVRTVLRKTIDLTQDPYEASYKLAIFAETFADVHHDEPNASEWPEAIELFFPDGPEDRLDAAPFLRLFWDVAEDAAAGMHTRSICNQAMYQLLIHIHAFAKAHPDSVPDAFALEFLN